MNISEQVKELRELAEYYEKNHITIFECNAKLLRQAADTIESLSAKLQEANMERPAGDCGGWIYCGDGNNMPKEEGFYLVSMPKTITDINDERVQRAFFNKKLNYFQGFSVSAWRPLPEPYHEP